VIPDDRAWALLGDAHLREGDPEVPAFTAFLDGLPGSIGVLAVLGDLFSAWIGRSELERPHHRLVLDAFRRLRARGCRVVYVEGNHDFFLRGRFAGDPFDLFDEASLDLRAAGRATHLAHGDLMNRHDRQYRAWRAISKSRPFFAAFNLIPLRSRLALVDRIEARMARTNMAFRGGFPVAEAIAYARPRLRTGTELLVFGHFHEERRIEVVEAGKRGVIFVLPAWRSGHRYLRLQPGAVPEFVSA
jgi:UDP-2,3-diacylglucosamine pyrophosphatase LpxH